MASNDANKLNQNANARRSLILLSSCVMGYVGWKLYEKYLITTNCKKEAEAYEKRLFGAINDTGMPQTMNEDGIFEPVHIGFDPDPNFKIEPFKTESKSKEKIEQELGDWLAKTRKIVIV